MPIKAATLCGKATLRAEWALRCMATWGRIEGLKEVLVINDGTLDEDAVLSFPLKDVPFRFLPRGGHEEPLTHFVSRFPSLQELRERSLVWRKMIDLVFLFRDQPQALYLDTDVHVVRRVSLPIHTDICAMFEGIPGGYVALPSFAFREPFILGLNAGMILFRPAAVDWALLERLACRYLLHVRDPWLTEQTAWAALAAHVAESVYFAPEHVRVFPGTWKHTIASIDRPEIRRFGSNRPVTRLEDVLALLDGASIVHFCSLGKRWICQFDRATAQADSDPPIALSTIPTRQPHPLDRALMALRFARLAR